MKTFEEFLKDFKSNADLAAKLEAALADVKNAEEKIAAIVKLAKENGYAVSVEDISGQVAGSKKLDDAELQLASGGMPDDWCPGDYICYAFAKSCGKAYQGGRKI